MTHPAAESRIAASEFDPVGRLAEEFLSRLRRGERPSLEEYAAGHPDLAARIREVFPLLAMMERFGPETDDSFRRRSAALRRPLVEGPRLERLGPYRLLREVGRGGMGIVYEAEQTALGRHVALKVLPANWSSMAGHVERFEREARAAAVLHHTNIVPVFDVGEQDGMAYYAMQFIHGLGLDEVLAELRRQRITPRDPAGAGGRGCPPREATRPVSATVVATMLLTGVERDEPPPANAAAARTIEASGSLAPSEQGSSVAESPGLSLSSPPPQPDISPLSESGARYWRSVARLGVQVAEALQYAHQHGTLHRDIKPSNLLLDLSGVVWVTDFGLAQVENEGDLTRSGEFVGTLRYMAPERFQGQSDARSDVYSVGLTLYELLTLRPAFDASARHQLVHQVLHDDPPRPRRLDSAIPRDLETIVLKASAREPSARYPTAGELAADLERFLEDRPILARRSGVFERTMKWARRRPAVAALIAALVLVAALGVGGILWQWQEAVAARDRIENALAEKSRALSAAERQRENADRSARRARQVSELLQGMFRGGDRVGLSTFFVDTPRISSHELTAVELLDRGTERIHELANDPETQVEIMETLGAIYLSLGKLEKSAVLLDAVYTLRTTRLDPEPMGLANALRMLVGLRYFQGRFQEAESLLREAARLDPRTDADLVRLMLALLRMEQDETDAAIREVERLLRVATDAHTHDPQAQRQRSLILMYLGVIRSRRNEHSLAVPLSLEAQRWLFDVEGGETLLALFEPVLQGLMKVELGDLGFAGHDDSDRQAGIDMVNDALERARRDLGVTHPVLGILLVEIGRYFEMKASQRDAAWYNPHAEWCYRRALEGFLEGCGRQPRTAACMERLALVLGEQTRHEEALQLLESALEIRRTVQGEAHAATRRTEELLRRAQRPDES